MALTSLRVCFVSLFCFLMGLDRSGVPSNYWSKSSLLATVFSKVLQVFAVLHFVDVDFLGGEPTHFSSKGLILVLLP